MLTWITQTPSHVGFLTYIVYQLGSLTHPSLSCDIYLCSLKSPRPLYISLDPCWLSSVHYRWTYHIVLIECAILHLLMLTWITPSHVSFLTNISHCMLTWITDTSITFIMSYVSILTWINKASLYPNFYHIRLGSVHYWWILHIVLIDYPILHLPMPTWITQALMVFWFWLCIHANRTILCWPQPTSPTALCWLRSPSYS